MSNRKNLDPWGAWAEHAPSQSANASLGKGFQSVAFLLLPFFVVLCLVLRNFLFKFPGLFPHLCDIRQLLRGIFKLDTLSLEVKQAIWIGKISKTQI